MRKLHRLVSAAATTFAVPANNAHLAGMGRKTWQEWHRRSRARRGPPVADDFYNPRLAQQRLEIGDRFSQSPL